MDAIIGDYKPSELKPHPKNETIYGQQEDISDLVELIEKAGDRIIERLIINKDNVIISGHRRWLAAQKLGIKTLPCEVMTFETPEDELEELVLRNAKRTKTTVQRIREGMTLEAVYASEAKQRRLANLNRNRSDVDTPSESSELGATRDKVAKKAGISSGKTYDRGKRVLEKVDELNQAGKQTNAELLTAVLNRSASSAETLLSVNLDELSDETRKALKLGKISPRSLLSGKDTARKTAKKPVSVNEEVNAIANSVKRLNSVALSEITDKQKAKIRDKIQAQIEDLGKLLTHYQ